MTFIIPFYKGYKRGKGNRQAYYALQNIVRKFIRTLDARSITIDDRYDKNIPLLDGMEEWAMQKYNITIKPEYFTEFKTNGHLLPYPMDGLAPSPSPKPHCVPFFLDNPYEHHLKKVNKSKIHAFMDPVFVGPRSLADRKFFRSQAIKLGIRRKLYPPYSSLAWMGCQTPELQRWCQDLDSAQEVFLKDGLDAANTWACSRGYDSVHFEQTEHQQIFNFSITIPGCEGLYEQEKLLFVMKFGNT
jgi:hypothetical protein